LKPEISETEKGIATDKQIQTTALDRPSLSVDVDYYQAVIDDPEVSDARKRELIEIIGAIVVNFIDIGFGVHPVQLAHKEGQQQELAQLDEKQTPPLQHEFKKENASERSDV